jgi:hypothetical protein
MARPFGHLRVRGTCFETHRLMSFIRNISSYFRVQWLKESGISDREYKYWIVQKPKCHGNTEVFTIVRLQDVYPALLVLAYGLLVSVLILTIEMLLKKFYCLKCRHYQPFHTFPYKK